MKRARNNDSSYVVVKSSEAGTTDDDERQRRRATEKGHLLTANGDSFSLFRDALSAGIAEETRRRSVDATTAAPVSDDRRSSRSMLLDRMSNLARSLLRDATRADAPSEIATCEQSSVSASPLLAYSRARATTDLVDMCSVGWLSSAAAATAGDESSAVEKMLELPAVPSAAIEETFAREIRHHDLRVVLERAVTTTERDVVAAKSPPTAAATTAAVVPRLGAMRTNVLCDYDVAACAALRDLADLDGRFRERYARVARARLARELETERRLTLEVNESRGKLIELRRAVDAERATTLVREARESELSNEAAALRLTLANAEAELRTLASLVVERLREQLSDELSRDPGIASARATADLATRERDALQAERVRTGSRLCDALRRMFHDDNNGDEVAVTVTAHWRQCTTDNVLLYYDDLLREEARCENCSSLILTATADETEAIVRQCAPLRRFGGIARLSELRRDLRAQEERYERLVQQERVRRRDDVSYENVGKRMHGYLRWLRCWDMLMTIWRPDCDDDEAIAVYRSGAAAENLHHGGAAPVAETSFMLQSFGRDDYVVRIARMVARDNSAEFSAAIHSLVPDAFPVRHGGRRCRAVLNRETFREILDDVRDGDANLRTVTQRLFRWSTGLPVPERRGMVFAVMASMCPLENSGEVSL